MKNRSRTEIISVILHTARTGTTKTKIMYMAYLSYSQLVSYLKLLGENKMISYDEGAQIYRTTERGIKFLEMANEITDMLAPPEDCKLN
ncbi:MAG TPA: winged helix-turn-helix domain-containing protein [Candidatus Nitrosotalea sp.]|nr:winged helix-turn-helix domain-containing protein [Candidatus Nitrosotalea sp.]